MNRKKKFGKMVSRNKNISNSTSTQFVAGGFTRSPRHKGHKTDHEVPFRKRAQAPKRLLFFSLRENYNMFKKRLKVLRPRTYHSSV